MSTSGGLNLLGLLVLWALGVLAAAFLGSWLGAYMKKKGENFATREDLQDVVEQVKAVTRTAEEIKSEIAGGLWDRQKQWELRRDTLFELAKCLTESDDAITKMYSVLSVRGELSATSEGESRWTAEWKSALE